MALFLFALLARLVASSVVHPYEQEAVCTVIELDAVGHTWVNGIGHAVDEEVAAGCPNDSVLVIAPDFSAPAEAVVEVAKQCSALGQPVRWLLPSMRREYAELFGGEPIGWCRTLTNRNVEPIPATGTVYSSAAVRVVRLPSSGGSPPAIDSLVIASGSPFGLVDDAATSHRAYDQSGGVRLIVESEERELEIRVVAGDLYIPPPPRLLRDPSGLVIRGAIDKTGECVYPEVTRR